VGAALLLAGCLSTVTTTLPAGAEDPEQLRVDAAEALRRGRMNRAADLYGQLARIEPTDPTIRNALGYALVKLERWEEAEPEFREALVLEPSSGEAHLGLGISLFQQGRSAEAAQVLQAGLDTLPEGAERDGWKRLVETQLPGVELQ
jgi:Flp pilus assembly protein TadD